MHEGLSPRRAIPSVCRILEELGAVDLPRPVITEAIRRHLADCRKSEKIPDFERIVRNIREALNDRLRSRLQSVVNGTGVILHTNFGRAPLAPEVATFVARIAGGYANVEFDLSGGGRGSRAEYLERNLAILCGAEAATVVNNCAAALVLAVNHFAAAGGEVIVSRGELIQIGGRFRIGEILTAAGAKLREVGSTNRTTLADYESALTNETVMILTVHRSNFFMEGFVETTRLSELARLARKRRIPLLADLGTGALQSTSELGSGGESEPTPLEVLKNGADLVCFSGDKLLGGPQSGILAGRRRFIARLKKEPLFRALRCDKLCLAALQATVDLHLRGASREIPALALLRIPKDELRARAAAIFARLRGLPAQITPGRSSGKVGGGTLPRTIVPSITIDIVPGFGSLEEFANALRNGIPPVIGYIAGDAVKLDLRTIFSWQDEAVVDAIRSACSRSGTSS
jgi:L-seryl-tRNA(Ser) seleniumtransferase